MRDNVNQVIWKKELQFHVLKEIDDNLLIFIPRHPILLDRRYIDKQCIRMKRKGMNSLCHEIIYEKH